MHAPRRLPNAGNLTPQFTGKAVPPRGVGQSPRIRVTIATMTVCCRCLGRDTLSFDHIAMEIDRWVDEGVVRGAAIAIEHRGRLVATRYAGEGRPGKPIDADTLFALASVSKPFTAAAVMRVIDQGLFTLDDEVASILPEFGSPDDPFADDALPQLEAQREGITFRHLLAHTSGLPENVGVKRLRMKDLPSLDHMLDIMTSVPLVSAPGEALRYSNLGPALAARAAERATGTPFHDLLQHTILDAMDLAGVALRPDASFDDRIAIVQDPAQEGTPAESYNSRYWRDMGIPWGGFFGTPTDVLRFATSFLPDRDLPLSDDAITAMTTDQVNGAAGGVESMGALWDPGFWGAGWEVKGTKRRHWTGSKSSPATFCHWGQSGTLVWVDPTRALGMAVFANRTVRTPWPLRPPRWADLSDALVDAADGAPGP
jgi:CubicO group peptidase (beta-lactamase class C family)